MPSGRARTSAGAGAGVQREVRWSDFPCKIWEGSTYWDGYGARRYNGKQGRAHRIEWEICTGEAPPVDMLVCHHCDTPRCYEFNHLFLGSESDNRRDALRKGRGPGKSKLTTAQVVEIKQRIAAGESLVSIAADYPVHKSTISNIKAGYSWSWIETPTTGDTSTTSARPSTPENSSETS